MTAPPSPDLLAYLLAAAVRLSGLPAIEPEQLPPVQMVDRPQLSATICPGETNQCTNIVAIFDTDGNRILVRDDLDLENATDNSFLVHELVHVLQFRSQGDAIFRDCVTTKATETVAYQVQNAYLRKEGQFARFGEALAFMTCAGDQNTFFTPEILGPRIPTTPP